MTITLYAYANGLKTNLISWVEYWVDVLEAMQCLFLPLEL